MNRRTIRNGALALTMSAMAVLLPAPDSEAQTSCSAACQQCLIQAQQYQWACYIACQYSGACPCTPESVAAAFAYCYTLP